MIVAVVVTILFLQGMEAMEFSRGSVNSATSLVLLFGVAELDDRNLAFELAVRLRMLKMS